MNRLLLLLVALLPLLAHAAPTYPDSACGMPAVGMTWDGKVWPADGQPKASPRMQVWDGYWHHCPAWVKDGEMPRRADPPKPKPCKAQDSVTWTGPEATCSASLAPAQSGFTQLATQTQGQSRGQATYQCTDGQWSQDPARSNCGPAPGCDNLQTITFGTDNACTVSYDARRKRLITGAEVALPADTKPGYSGSAVLRCEFGSLVVKTSRCIKQ